MSSSQPASRLISGRYPPEGTSSIADRIRKRRGARGITPLDANLLHFPEAAAGYNELLGALRTGGRLPGDVREVMILRIAALNNAPFEWIQHEPIGRTQGLTIGQLYIIRDTETPLPPMLGIFSPLHLIALEFTDAVTRTAGLSALDTSTASSANDDDCGNTKFTIELGHRYKQELRKWLEAKQINIGEQPMEDAAEDLYAEACLVISAYNMVSRFLVSTDVKGLTGTGVPWPQDQYEDVIEVPSYPSLPSSTQTHTIRTVVLRDPHEGEDEPEWVLFANSLLTSLDMWSYIIPWFLDGGVHSSSNSPRKRYNLILHDQRGHGRSSLPSAPTDADDGMQTTIPLLAQDIQSILVSPEIRTLIDGSPDGAMKPIKAVIGVSQGGAAALALAALQSSSNRSTELRKVRSVVACDTSAKTAPGNKGAWAERVRLVYAAEGSSDIVGDVSSLNKGDVYARKVGMGELANVTVPRWFPPPSPLNEQKQRNAWVRNMVEKTSVEGFVAGAQALASFDLLPALYSSLDEQGVERALLVAGSLDGAGKVGAGLKKLKTEWEENGGQGKVEYVEVEESGHLPMVDCPEVWAGCVGRWLSSF